MNTELIERLLCLLDVRLHAIALCNVDPGSRLRLPQMDSMLVHYVLQGEGVLSSDESRPIGFGRDTVIFVPRELEHDIFGAGAETAEPVIWQDSAVPFGDGMMRLSAGSSEGAIVTAWGTIDAECEGVNLFERFREPVLEDLSGSPAVRTAFKAMQGELEQPRFGTRLLAEALMKQCLVLAIRQQMDRGDLRLLTLIGAHDPRLTRALLAIMEDPAQDHSLEELAAISGMSRSLFAECFAEAFSRPPMDLVRQVRLHRAANLLRATSLPVQVIGMAVGYASRSYFSRAFRAAYGKDPRSFRQLARGAPERSHPDRSDQRRSGAPIQGERQ